MVGNDIKEVGRGWMGGVIGNGRKGGGECEKEKKRGGEWVIMGGWWREEGV